MSMEFRKQGNDVDMHGNLGVEEDDDKLQRSQSYFGCHEVHCYSQRTIRHPRINLRRRNLLMPERSLNQVQVAGLLVEPGGESMADHFDLRSASQLTTTLMVEAWPVLLVITTNR